MPHSQDAAQEQYSSTSTTTITFTATAPAGATLTLGLPVPSTPIPPPTNTDVLFLTAGVAIIVDPVEGTEERVTILPANPQIQTALQTSSPTNAPGASNSSSSQDSVWQSNHALLISVVVIAAIVLIAAVAVPLFCLRRWRGLEKNWEARKLMEEAKARKRDGEEREWQEKRYQEGTRLTREQWQEARARAAELYEAPMRSASLRSVDVKGNGSPGLDHEETGMMRAL